LFILLCFAALIGVLILADAEFMAGFLPDPIRPAGEITRSMTQSNTMGDPNAPIHMIEYGDYQCSYCVQFWSETEPLLVQEYVNTGKVFFEYRSMGDFLGSESAWAAEGTYCAGDQGKFWELHDALYANWSREKSGNFTEEKIIQYAESIKLDVDLFKSCLDDDRHVGTVEQDAARAEADGATATPTFIINGRKMEGAQSFRVLKHILDEILNGSIHTIPG
jgi:protein-disulfide isomerase